MAEPAHRRHHRLLLLAGPIRHRPGSAAIIFPSAALAHWAYRAPAHGLTNAGFILVAVAACAMAVLVGIGGLWVAGRLRVRRHDRLATYLFVSQWPGEWARPRPSGRSAPRRFTVGRCGGEGRERPRQQTIDLSMQRPNLVLHVVGLRLGRPRRLRSATRRGSLSRRRNRRSLQHHQHHSNRPATGDRVASAADAVMVGSPTEIEVTEDQEMPF